MWRKLKVPALGSMVVMLAITTACGKDNVKSPVVPSASPSGVTSSGNSVPKTLSQAGNMIALGSNDVTLPMKQIGKVKYVSVQDLIKLLKFQSEWEDSQRKLIFGENDANFELIINSNKAIKDGTEVNLSQPIVKEGSVAYLPLSDLADLFQDDLSYDVRTNGMFLIHASPIEYLLKMRMIQVLAAICLNWISGEDPSDPFKGEDTTVNPAMNV